MITNLESLLYNNILLGLILEMLPVKKQGYKLFDYVFNVFLEEEDNIYELIEKEYPYLTHDIIADFITNLIINVTDNEDVLKGQEKCKRCEDEASLIATTSLAYFEKLNELYAKSNEGCSAFDEGCIQF